MTQQHSARHSHKIVWPSSMCDICGAIRSRRGNRCSHCRADTPTRDTVVGNMFQDRRQPGHQDTTTSQPLSLPPPSLLLASSTTTNLPLGSQPIPEGEPLDDSLIPNSPIRDIVITGRDAQLLGELHRASGMAMPRSMVSLYATAWAESLKGTLNGHQSWATLADIGVEYCWRKFPKDWMEQPN